MRHFKSLLESYYYGGHDLPEEGLLIKIIGVEVGTVENKKLNKTDTKAIMTAEGIKPIILNATNMKHICRCLGTADVDQWAGGEIKLMPTEKEWNEGSKSFNGRRIQMLEAGAIGLRVHPLPLDKPEFSPANAQWGAAIKAIKKGQSSIEYIENKYKLTASNKAKLEKETKNDTE